MKERESSELHSLRKEHDFKMIKPILKKIEFRSKCPEPFRKECENEFNSTNYKDLLKIRTRPPKNLMKKTEKEIEVEFDLITVEPRDKLPGLDEISGFSDARNNTLFGVVEDRTMLLFKFDMFNPPLLN